MALMCRRRQPRSFASRIYDGYMYMSGPCVAPGTMALGSAGMCKDACMTSLQCPTLCRTFSVVLLLLTRLMPGHQSS